MLWRIATRGFLPATDPITALPSSGPFAERFRLLDDLGAALPDLNDAHTVRSELVARLRAVQLSDELFAALGEAETERMMLLFSYFGSAFVYATGQPPADRIPREIAGPLVRLSRRVGRPPILAYANYCLTNWSGSGDFNPDRLTLRQNFTRKNKRDEDWFILIHVAIEKAAARAVIPLYENVDNLAHPAIAGQILPVLREALTEMNAILARMGENCRPEVYFHGVRPYIFGFNNVFYEGCFDDKPQSYRGETGAQSSIVPSFVSALGLVHQDSLLTKHLRDMRNYMPVPHREFLAHLDGHAQEKASLRVAAVADSKLKAVYNDCLDGLVAFRKAHLQLAIDYIAKRVESPQGTGGTPYMEWLGKLVQETEQHKL
jgi:indoleamine 2,3-dioxygenase